MVGYFKGSDRMSYGPFLTPREQVEHSISKGITFNNITEAETEQYLVENNNYFKLRAFRKNFLKSTKSGKYVNLDFSYLIDLACIDNRLRRIMLEMAIGIEHFSKVHLLSALQQGNIDPYVVVEDYMNQLEESNFEQLQHDLWKNSGSLYCGNLYAKYIEDQNKRCPVWAFLEMISFGQYLYFYKYCAELLQNTEITERLYLMYTVKSLRNACAHNNCIINDINSKHNKSINADLSRECAKFIKSPSSRRRHLRHISTYQILTTMYAHQRICISTGVHNHICVELDELKQRFFRDNDYRVHDNIKATFDVLIRAIDTWFHIR